MAERQAVRAPCSRATAGSIQWFQPGRQSGAKGAPDSSRLRWPCPSGCSAPPSPATSAARRALRRRHDRDGRKLLKWRCDSRFRSTTRKRAVSAAMVGPSRRVTRPGSRSGSSHQTTRCDQITAVDDHTSGCTAFCGNVRPSAPPAPSGWSPCGHRADRLRPAQRRRWHRPTPDTPAACCSRSHHGSRPQAGCSAARPDGKGRITTCGAPSVCDRLSNARRNCPASSACQHD